jgi:integrase
MAGRKNKIGFPGSIYARGQYLWYTVKHPSTGIYEYFALKHPRTGNGIISTDMEKAKEVAKKLWLELIDPKPARPVDSRTLFDIAGRYGKYAETKYTRSTEDYRIKWAVGYLMEFCGQLPIEQFGPLKLQEFQSWLIQKKTLTRKVINSIIRMCRNMFKWAVSQQVADITQYQSLMTVEGLREGHPGTIEKPPISTVRQETWQAIKVYTSTVVFDMLQIQGLTGMRSGELVIMRPADINRQSEIWEYNPPHKMQYRGQSRTVYFGPQAQAILMKYLQGEYCFSPAAAQEQLKKHNHTFLGKHYTPASYRRAIWYALNAEYKARLEEYKNAKEKPKQKPKPLKFTPHQLRHTAGTRIRAEFGLDASKAALGHKSVKANEVYSELDQRKAMEVAKKIG